MTVNMESPPPAVRRRALAGTFTVTRWRYRGVDTAYALTAATASLKVPRTRHGESRWTMSPRTAATAPARSPNGTAARSLPPDLEPRNRAAATLKLLRRRVGQRSQRLRSFALIGVQSGLAAALAWVVARQVLNTPDPVFAPVVAISVIASAIGQHLPRTLQLLGGVVLGVATGDFLINLIGVGA